jgi:hypothetical protein
VGGYVVAGLWRAAAAVFSDAEGMDLGAVWLVRLEVRVVDGVEVLGEGGWKGEMEICNSYGLLGWWLDTALCWHSGVGG